MIATDNFERMNVFEKGVCKSQMPNHLSLYMCVSVYGDNASIVIAIDSLCWLWCDEWLPQPLLLQPPNATDADDDVVAYKAASPLKKQVIDVTLSLSSSLVLLLVVAFLSVARDSTSATTTTAVVVANSCSLFFSLPFRLLQQQPKPKQQKQQPSPPLVVRHFAIYPEYV